MHGPAQYLFGRGVMASDFCSASLAHERSFVFHRLDTIYDHVENADDVAVVKNDPDAQDAGKL